MEDDLGAAIIDANERGIPVKDICFSGNGEPTMSDDLGPALEIAGRVRDQMAAEAALVLITNGTGLLQGDTFNLLKDATKPPLSLDIWLKLDAGTLEWYEKMSRSDIPFETLIEKIRVFASGSPITLQTMLCAIDGEAPPKEEALALENYITRIALDTREHASKGALLRKVQIYGKARPAPEDPKASALPAEYLEERAASLRRALEEAGLPQGAPPVEVYP
ncbi:MAG: hypothetical protein FWG77_08915 [Treponema sp.]|nr:hypothetical protein [Treponema sp.]